MMKCVANSRAVALSSEDDFHDQPPKIDVVTCTVYKIHKTWLKILFYYWIAFSIFFIGKQSRKPSLSSCNAYSHTHTYSSTFKYSTSLLHSIMLFDTYTQYEIIPFIQIYKYNKAALLYSLCDQQRHLHIYKREWHILHSVEKPCEQVSRKNGQSVKLISFFIPT